MPISHWHVTKDVYILMLLQSFNPLVAKSDYKKETAWDIEKEVHERILLLFLQFHAFQIYVKKKLLKFYAIRAVKTNDNGQIILGWFTLQQLKLLSKKIQKPDYSTKTEIKKYQVPLCYWSKDLDNMKDQTPLFFLFFFQRPLFAVLLKRYSSCAQAIIQWNAYMR